VIISVVSLVVTFIFWMRWNKDQKAIDSNEVNAQAAPVH
jgi:hypothetical protein